MLSVSRPITSQELRRSFIGFFTSKDHRFVPSSPVVPNDDPTLLFANAGMNQFKSVLLGGDNPTGLRRAVNSQKCIRVSGKHNDLDVVGRDSYHHTFFEMLGNWSFGDYFKREAIAWSWELLTEVWMLPKERLWATVYEEDDEALSLWQEVTDINPSHILRSGRKDNFWEMGDVGPCGPCTEIHFDFGPENDPRTGERGYVAGVNVDGCERFIEIWNNVFMQHERLEDGSLRDLPARHVDTGMGFERILRAMQGVASNYDTDVFSPLLARVADLTGIPYDRGTAGTPHRVIADHLRALAFSIADGATPSNEGRGYVLRRLLRRAARFSRELGARRPVICEVVPVLVEVMGEAFPELIARQSHIITVIRDEEERFGRTLDQGLERFQKAAKSAKGGVIEGNEVFRLHDTYGFPVDLTEQMALEKGLTIDLEGYARAMEEQKERARSQGRFISIFNSLDGWTVLRDGHPEFVGYETLVVEHAETLRFREHEDDVWIVLARTPFYAESGGQVGDIGVLQGKDGLVLRVLDTQNVSDLVVLRARLEAGSLTSSNVATVRAEVDKETREATRRNHSAVHLLHAALREVLGGHVQQQGSWVGPEGFRFDFVHGQAMTESDIQRVEDMVCRAVRDNLPVLCDILPVDQARASGAMALFGEKYGDAVRVLTMGGMSRELCGGTHVEATGQIGLMRIVRESSISAGVRRIEGVAGAPAWELLRRQAMHTVRLAQTLKCAEDEVGSRVAELALRLRSAEKEIESLRVAALLTRVPTLMADAVVVGGVRVLAANVTAHCSDAADLGRLADAFEASCGSRCAILLAMVHEERVSMVVIVSEDVRHTITAGALVQEAARHVDGKGGGKPTRAQAGGRNPAGITAAFEGFVRSITKAMG